MAGEYAAGELTRLRWHVPDFHLHTQIIWHKDQSLSPALRGLVTLSRELAQ